MNAGRVLVTLALLLGALGGCDGDPLLPAPGSSILIDFGDVSHPWPRDGWRLEDARLDGVWLELSVAYGGGCREHQFWLVAVEDWEILPTAGPIPMVGVPTLLAHEDHDDPCDAWITRELHYDLEPLRTAYHSEFGAGPATILVRIPRGQGAPDTLTLDLDVPAVFPQD